MREHGLFAPLMSLLTHAAEPQELALQQQQQQQQQKPKVSRALAGWRGAEMRGAGGVAGSCWSQGARPYSCAIQPRPFSTVPRDCATSQRHDRHDDASALPWYAGSH